MIRRPFSRSFAAAALGVALVLGSPLSGGPATVAAQDILPPGPRSALTVETATGVYPFEVEVADEGHERAQGLMYRRNLPQDQGMLFDMEATRQAGFWMRNTFVSLDIIFIGEDGRVRTVAERAEPLSEAVIDSGVPIRFVLELVAGSARRIGLEPGDRVHHPVIDAVAGR